MPGSYIPSSGSSPQVSQESEPQISQKKVPVSTREVHQLATRKMASLSELSWVEYLLHIFDFTGNSQWIPVGVVDQAKGIFTYAKIADIKKLGITNKEISSLGAKKEIAASARALDSLIRKKITQETQEQGIALLLEEAIHSKNQKRIDRVVNLLLWAEYDSAKIWQKVLARLKPEEGEQLMAKRYYKASVIKDEIKTQNVLGVSLESLVKICEVAEQAFEKDNKNQKAQVIQKADEGIDHSLLIDFKKRTFTLLGLGPIKAQGGCGKVRSAIEVSLKQVANELSEEAVACHVVRKTNLPKEIISERELEDERLFGNLHTATTYTGKKGVQKTTFTMDAYQGDILDLLQTVDNKKRPPLTFPEKLQLLDCMASQLELMHETYTVIHNDLKPDNVLFRRTKEGKLEAKIIDFGLCYRPERGESPCHLQCYGTPAYTSPEVVTDCNRKFTIAERKAQDMYAFGCIAYTIQHNSSLPWMDDIEAALAKNDVDAKKRGLAAQEKEAKASLKNPSTAEEAFDHCMLGLLQTDPSKRLTIKQARQMIDNMRHTFIGDL